MRTKVLLCAAALAASLASSMAQSNVYSLNVVGYYNITIGAGQKVMIANQLNTTNNSIGALLAPPMVSNNDQIFKYAGGFSESYYSTDDGQWDPDPTVSMNPGEAVFYQATAATTLTFVGEVMQGSLTNNLGALGSKVMRSSMVPQQGRITTDLGLLNTPNPDNNDQIFTYNGGYTEFYYSTDDGQWDPQEPVINVGQGFFFQSVTLAQGGTPANVNWVRNFTVQ